MFILLNLLNHLELLRDLGMKTEQNEQNGCVWIGQCAYTESLLKRFGMEDCKQVNTPIDASSKLTHANQQK